MNARQIRALLREDAFPHAVSNLRLVETHISWVLLTGNYAYKIKKPVEMGFLDFTTLASRRRFCAEELRLNRRLAPELYLDVVPVTLDADRPRIGGAGEPVDFAVRMRQFEQRRLASVAAAEGRLTFAQCRQLGRRVAEFHNALAPIHLDATMREPQPGTPAAILAAVRQNFAQIDEALAAGEDRAVLRDLECAALDDYQRLEARMWERLDAGFVRDCHGDLHLGNIALLEDRPVPFDCIEFNPAFRMVDIQCEIGFLVMDLEGRSLPRHANRVMNGWLEYTGDYAGLALHSFYDSYLAMVRSKISLIAAVASSPDDPELDDHRRYLALANAGRRRLPGFLCITMGVSGSGKTTVAESLAGEFSAIRLRSDVERKRLAGLAPEADSAAAGLGDALYSEEMSERVFQHLLDLATIVLDTGLPVIVDASFIARSRRRPFLALAAQRRLPFIIASCIAAESELARRVRARKRRGHDASEADIGVMLKQLRQLEPPVADEAAHCIVVDTQAAGHAEGLAGEVERRITSRARS